MAALAVTVEPERTGEHTEPSPETHHGQYQSTQVEALRAEAGVPSYTTSSRRTCLMSWERGRKMPDDHPRRLAEAVNVLLVHAMDQVERAHCVHLSTRDQASSRFR